MMSSRRTGGLLTILVGLILAGCSGGHGTTAPFVTVGVAGGSVLGPSGAQVVVPAGALAHDTTIGIAQTSVGAPGLPAGTTPFGPTFAFTPHGTSFAVPVTITVPFDPSAVPAGASPKLYKTNADQSRWEVVPGATVDGNRMSGQVTGFSYAVVAPQLFFFGPIRTWQFFAEDNLEGLSPFGPEDRQDDFISVSDSVDLGPLPTQEQDAKMEVFSSASGFTYWTSAEAPRVDDLSVRGVLIGSEADLRTTYLFFKSAADARFKLVVSAAKLQLSDFDIRFPTYAQCPWSPDQDRTDCERVLQADVDFEVTLDNISRNQGTAIAGGYARLTGWNDNWHIQAGSAGVGEAIWEESSFDLAVAEEAVTASLPKSITVEVPLDNVGVGEVFAVKVLAASHAVNHRQTEGSYAGAFFRDPAHADGVTVEASGVEPASPDLLVAFPEPQPAGPCPGGATAAGGTVEFPAASFREPEFGGGFGARITVRRAGGSQGEASVLVSTGEGTATAGSDYTATSKIVHFADGESGEQVVRIPLLADGVQEPDETVNLTLSDPRGCVQLGEQRTAVLTILDDDRPVVLPAFYTVGGTVDGLAGTGLVLREVQGGSEVTPANGPFTFPVTRVDGSMYEVRVESQPTNPIQICTVANGTGTVRGADVTDVAVTCTTPLAPGDLDPSFGDGGRAVTNVPYESNEFDPRIGMALQGDGKILLVGGLKLLRLTAEGKLDESFGKAGVVDVVFDGGDRDSARDVAVQADGKIVVAGTTATFVSGSDNFALTRFDPQGKLDSTFGTAGHATTDFFGSTDEVRRMRLQDDGKILVVGRAVHPISPISGSVLFAIARYNADGTPDLTFSGDGNTTDSPGQVFSEANGIAIQGDGKIVVAGSTAASGAEASDTGFVRYLGDGQVQLPGTRDDSFGPAGNGTLQAPLGPFSEVVDVVTLSDGTILGAVEVSSGLSGGGFAFGLAHVPASGVPPPRVPQPVVSFTTQSDVPYSMLKQADGKIVVVGQSANLGTNPDMAIVRFDDSGLALDQSFGTGGKLMVDFFGGRDSAEAIVQQADGKLVVGGFARSGAGNVFAAARLAQ